MVLRKNTFLTIICIAINFYGFGQIDSKVRVKKDAIIKQIPEAGRVFLFYLAANNGSFEISSGGNYYYDSETREYLVKQIKEKGYEPVVVRLCENDPVENKEGVLPMPSACSIEAMGYNGARDVFMIIYEEDYSTTRTYTVEKERTVGTVTDKYGRTVYSYVEPYKEERIKTNKYINFRTAVFYYNDAASVNELIYDYSFWGPSNNENRLLKKVMENLPERVNKVASEDRDLSDDDLFSESAGDKYGYKSRKSGKWIIEPMYDNAAYNFSFGLAAVSKGGKYVPHSSIPGWKDLVGSKWGFINKTGATVIPFQYDKALNFSEDLAAVKINNMWGFINTKGVEVIVPRYSEAQSFASGLALIFSEDRVYKFINKEGKIAIPISFEQAESFKGGLAWVQVKGKQGIINSEGLYIIQPKYDEIRNRDFSFHKFSPVKLNGKWGLIDKNGKEIIPLEYEDFEYYSAGFSKVKKNGKWGVINESDGTFFLECLYDDIQPLKIGEYGNETDKELVQVKKEGKWGIVNSKTLKWLINPLYDELSGKDEGMIAFKKNVKWGVIDRLGNEILPAVYDRIGNFYEGITSVGRDNKHGYADKTGKMITQLIYEGENGNSFTNGYAFVCRESGCGYIDKSGNEITDLKYTWDDGWNPFNYSLDGLAAVKLKGKWGYINTKGETVIKHQFDQAWPFRDGIAAVNAGGQLKSGFIQNLVGGKWGYIDKEGRQIVKIKYDNVGRYFSEGMGSVKVNGKWGFVNANGDIVIKPQFDDADYYYYTSFSEGLVAVRLNGKWGFIDKNGATVIDFLYESAGFFENGKATVKLNGKDFEIDKTGRKID